MIGSTLYLALLVGGLLVMRTGYDGHRIWPLLPTMLIIPAPVLADLLHPLA